MPQALVTKVRGLYTSPNEHGEIPPGALTRAQDIVLSRDSVAELRRGQRTLFASGAQSIFAHGRRLFAVNGGVLSKTDEAVAALTPFAGDYDPPAGARTRAVTANKNLYFTTADGVKRLDDATTEPVDAGVPAALDINGNTTGAAGFLPADSAVAYRACWGLRDANGNLLLGAPSGRAVVVNSSAAAVDVALFVSVPDGLGPNHFLQIYRTQPSAAATIDPGDEMGLVYEGQGVASVPDPVAVTQLARVSNVVTATTAAAHPLFTGQIVRVSPGGTVSSSLVAISSVGIVRSSDGGATWSAAGVTAPAVTWYGLAVAGSTLVVVGEGGIASSADGATWTLRRTGSFRAVTHTGARFVAVGLAGTAAYSSDGVTWTTITTIDSTVDLRSVAWSGSKVVAAGVNLVTYYVDGEPITEQHGYTITSATGVTWSGPKDHGTDRFNGICWTGARWVIVGGDPVGTDSIVRVSADGLSWTTVAAPGPDMKAVCWTGSKVLACGLNTVWSSTDGTSGWTAATVTGAWESIVFSGATAYLGGTDLLSTSDASGVTWTDRTAPAGVYRGAGPATGSVSFAAGEYTITATTATTFTYAETGADGSLVAPQTATPLTSAIIDSIPSAFAGATLYTSQSQEGILQSAYEPPACVDLCVFKDSVFWLGTTDRATLQFWLLACGAPSGIQSGDTVTINGVLYAAGATENPTTRTFQVYTAGTPSQNVANTAASLVRVVNRAPSSVVYLRDLSSANEQPGRLQITSRVRSQGVGITTSRPSAFAFTSGQTAVPETHDDEIRWSPARKPDSAPIVNTKRFGVKGLRCIALRDAVFVLTEGGGIYRITGENAEWSILPFDTTTEIVAPWSAVALDNIIFALSSKGVVQISDTGVTIISKPIEDQIKALLAEPMLSNVRATAHAAAYEAEGRYILWAPATSSESTPSRAFVYDHYASLASGAPVWTTRSDAAACALVNPQDGRLYTATSTEIRQERKSLTAADYADGEIAVTLAVADFNASTVTVASATGIEVGDGLAQGSAFALIEAIDGTTLTLDRAWSGAAGAATVEKAITGIVQFAPFIPAPGAQCRFHELALLLRWAGAGTLTADMASEITRGMWSALPVEFPAPLPGDTSEGFASVLFHLLRDYGNGESAGLPLNLRTWIPREQQRGARLMLRLTYRAARSPLALEGVSLTFSPLSVRVRR